MKAKGKSLKEPKHRNQTVLMGVKFRKLFTLQAPMITVSARYSEITQSAIAFDLINAFYKKKKKNLGTNVSPCQSVAQRRFQATTKPGVLSNL